MRLLLVIWNLCALALACYNCNGRRTLQTEIETTFGAWHQMEHCPQGMYVNGMSIKYLPWLHGDNSALNGVRFFCNSPASYSCSANNILWSGTAYGGAWQNNQWCPNDQFLVGFAFRHNLHQSNIDNTGIVNFAAYCGYPFGERTAHKRIEGASEFGGTWTSNKFCPVGYVLCGLQSRVHPWSSTGDDHGITNYQMDCCEVSDIHCTPGHQILTLTKLDNSHGKKVASLSYDVKTSFTITSEHRTPSNTENKIISQKLGNSAESLAHRINAEIGQTGNHVTASSLRSMFQDAMGHGSTRTFKVQVPKKTQAIVKQVYLTCGVYRIALSHAIEEGTKKPGKGGKGDHDHDHSSEDDC